MAKTAASEEKTGPPLLLAERWDNAQDLAGWWLSEKLDGVRAYWDGKSLISRLGNRFHAPDWFLEGLPEIPLDGELWIGRKAFQRTVGIVRRQDQTDLWKQVRYVAFDAPDVDGAFEDRLAAIRAHVERHRPPYLAAHEHVICTGLDHLRAELARIEALGGEGLMLRQPESRYEVGRSLTLLKVKSFHDAEARVLEHLKGAGRHKGRLGALLVELADGTQFSVGTGFSDAERGGAAAGRLRHHLPLPGAFRRRRAPVPVLRRRAWRRRLADHADDHSASGRQGLGFGQSDAPGTVASGPAVRVDRGIVEQVLGSGPRRLRGDRALRPDRKRWPGQDQGARERRAGPAPRRRTDRGEGCQGISRTQWGVVSAPAENLSVEAGLSTTRSDTGLAGSFSRRVRRSWACLVSKQEEQFGWDLEVQALAQVDQQPDVGGLKLCKLVVRWAGRGVADVESSEFFQVVGELTDLVASRLGDETVVSHPGRFRFHPRKGLLLETFDGGVVKAAEDFTFGFRSRLIALDADPEAVERPAATELFDRKDEAVVRLLVIDCVLREGERPSRGRD